MAMAPSTSIARGGLFIFANEVCLRLGDSSQAGTSMVEAFRMFKGMLALRAIELRHPSIF
jgi:hypothetical protein